MPPEVIRATIRANQKCFVLRRRPTGKLANKFILVSNLVAQRRRRGDRGRQRARRARAAVRRAPFLADRPRAAAGLQGQGREAARPAAGEAESAGIVFHEKLGTQGERVERIEALARELAPQVGADPALAERAAHLAKADLVDRNGRRVPRTAGPDGPLLRDRAGRGAERRRTRSRSTTSRKGRTTAFRPSPVSIAVALADKLDTLVGFWAIDEKPTGSKDPYALRRAALGVIRIVLENDLRLPLLRR